MYLRLSKQLKMVGFVARHLHNAAPNSEYVRSDTNPLLFQQIDLSFAGKQKEAVFAYISISTTKWIRIKGLTFSRLLIEIASDKERGWSVIQTEAEAIEWEKTLVQLAPSLVANLALTAGDDLLVKTAAARNRAERILASASRYREPSERWRQLEQSSPRELISAATRLAESPGVMQVPGAEEVYQLACALVLNAKATFADGSLNPLEHTELMWTIQLVADAILSQDVPGQSGS